MSKIGVGIGEDFPVDDGKPGEGRPGEGRREGRDGSRSRDGARFAAEDDAAYAARREAHRKWREARREWKRQWRDEWRARRHEFRDQFRGSYYDGDRGHRAAWGFGHPFFWGRTSLWGLLAFFAAVALIVFAFTHIYFVLGGLVLLALFVAAHRRGFDPFDLPPHEYTARPTPPPAQPPAPTEPPRDSAH